MVKYLVQNCGAEIDAKPKADGSTALHDAAKRGSLEIVKFLVETGAEIDVRNNNNETPFYLSNRNEHKEISKYLLEKKRDAENKTPQENINNKALCIMCFSARNGFYVLNPCGHMSLCEPCCFNLTQERYSKCPSCRKPIRDYTKIFFQEG